MSLGARRIGFIASALLHAGVAGVFLLPGSAPVESAPTERRVALSLDMFESRNVAPPPTTANPESSVPRQSVVQAPSPLPEEAPELPPVTPEPSPPEDVGEPPVPVRVVETKPVRQPPKRPLRKPVVKPRPPRRMIAPPVADKPPAKPEPRAVAVPPEDSPVAPSHQAETTVREVPAAQISRLQQDYLADLVSAIHRNKYYPRKARRHSEQGTLIVAFTIERDGSLSEIGVRRSSGVRRLDEAALETLRRLTPVRPIPAALNRDRWPITVPIEFRLR